MEIQSGKQVDLLYALFLGRMPENNFVREDNFGRPVLDLVRAMIASEEFRQTFLERFLLHEQLPHRGLPLQLLPDALELIADAWLAPPNVGPMAADWKTVLGRVLADTPCRGMVEEALGKEGRRLIERLNLTQLSAPPQIDDHPPAPPPTSASDIASGAEIVANTVCRGWLVDRANLNAPLHIKIKLNGGIAKVLLADEFRRDVQDLYGGEGRAGFSVRLDLLSDARFLSRATIEIAELSSGTVVLPERVVEFSIAPAVRIEAEMREALSSVRDCLDRLNANFPKEEKNRWKIPFSTALRSPRAGIADTNAVEIREELTKMGKSLSNLEKELPQFWNKQSWALSYFNVVRALLQLVIDPPKVHEPATSSLLIIHDAAEPDATAATLASVLGQTLKPRDIFLIAPADALLDFAPSSAALEVVRLEPDQLPMDAANSVAARTNGSHLLILDAGVVLVPEALAWLAAAIEQTGGSIIYTDGEITAPDEGGSERLLPLFRPAFDYDLLLQRNYIGKAFCIERQTYMALGGFSCDPMVDPYHDFLLRAVIRCGRGAFIHLPLLLVSVRPSVSSGGLGTERERTLRTVQAHLDRLGTGAQAVAHADPFGRSLPDAAKIQWPEGSVGRVSVIIPTRDRADMVFALISSLRRHAAAWDRVEIIVVVNGKLDPQSEFAFSEIGKVFDQVQILYRQIPFNWGEINNLAVDESCTGETIVFLNDDIVCLTDSWDDRLRSQLRRPEIGAVGGRLLYPNGVIQHAGITFCGDGVTAHEAMGDLASEGLYLDRTLLVHEIAAVTGAFLACRRTLFDQLQGFDAERYTITSSDADFCVRVRATGASVIYDPFLTWIHYESITRGRDSHDYKKHWRAEAEQEAWRSNFLEIDLVDLGLNPHLVCFARPFEVFHRPSQEGIGLWLQAQLRRREQWSEAACRVPS